MNNMFLVVPRFLKDPHAFYQSVQKDEDLKGKTLALFISAVVFLMIYGLVTGLSHSWQQGLSTAVKMPLLFMATLAFTLPALYFFALALLNVRFSVPQATVIVLSGIGVSAFLLLGLAPVTFFFVLTSTNYAFFQLLAVVFVAISGFTGLYYILKGVRYIDLASELSDNSIGNVLLKSWVGLFGFVGAQMTWRLSPLIGDPTIPFILFRPSRDNFFVDVYHAIQEAVGVGSSRAGSFDFTLFFCGGFVLLLIVVIALIFIPKRKPNIAVAAPPSTPARPVDPVI